MQLSLATALTAVILIVVLSAGYATAEQEKSSSGTLSSVSR